MEDAYLTAREGKMVKAERETVGNQLKAGEGQEKETGEQRAENRAGKRAEEKRLYDGEYRFMELVWDHEPVRSMELARLCLEVLGWKKSTCFTVLKKLSEWGFVKNERAVVTSLVKRVDVQKKESRSAVDRNFGGSLPAFVAAFLSDRRLTKEEADEIRAMIEKAVK